MTRLFLPIGLLVTSLSTIAQTFNLNQVLSPAASYVVELPVEYISNKIIIPVNIEGKTERFILDTGAPTAIKESLYQKLKPELLFTTEISDINNQKDSLKVAQLSSVALGSAIFQGVPVLIMQDGLITECFEVAGLLGSNLLSNSVVQINTQRQTVIISDRINQVDVDQARASAMQLDQQSSPLITIQIGSRVKEVLLFDSGSDDLYSMTNDHLDLFKKTGEFKVLAKSYGAATMGLYGTEKSSWTSRLSIPALSVNGVIIHNVIAETNNDINSRIGARLLDYGIVTLDYGRQQFYFEPFEQETHFDEVVWNASLTYQDGNLAIGRIWDKNLSKDLVGLPIVSINGITLEQTSVCSLMKNRPLDNQQNASLELRKKDNTIVTVELSR